MSAVTALVFVGHSHPNDGGLRPSVLIQLEEGSRPCYSFMKLGRGLPAPTLTVIPTLESMLDDLILMIAYAVVKVPDVVAIVDQFVDPSALSRERIEMYTDLTEAQRNNLYNLLKTNQDLPKIGICLFKGSSLKHNIQHLNQYLMECEVSESTFVRSWSAWNGKWSTSGSL